jgi:hypothetical protein
MSSQEKEELQQLCDKCNNKPCYQWCADIFRIKLSNREKELLELKNKTSILFHPQLRNSRFDFNARYIRFDEATQIAEFQVITMALKEAKNFEPYPISDWVAYRRGTGGLWLYFVPKYDFRVPRERKSHKEKS